MPKLRLAPKLGLGDLPDEILCIVLLMLPIPAALQCACVTKSLLKNVKAVNKDINSAAKKLKEDKTDLNTYALDICRKFNIIARADGKDWPEYYLAELQPTQLSPLLHDRRIILTAIKIMKIYDAVADKEKYNLKIKQLYKIYLLAFPPSDKQITLIEITRKWSDIVIYEKGPKWAETERILVKLLEPEDAHLSHGEIRARSKRLLDTRNEEAVDFFLQAKL